MAGIYHPFSRLKPRVLNGTPSAPDVLKHGIYIKPTTLQPHWEVMFHEGFGTNNRTTWDARLSEIQESSNFRGLQVNVPWGLYEQGVSGGDFSNLQYLVNVADELQAIGKYMILELGNFREFRNNNVASLPLLEQLRYLLPPDMAQQNAGLYTSPTAGGPDHYLSNWAFAYDKFLNNNFGYDLKMYKSTLRDRLTAFYTAVANVLGNHPAVIAITTTESVMGTAITTQPGGFAAAEGASERNFLDGKTLIMDVLKSLFPNKMVMQTVNYPNLIAPKIDYVGEWFGALAAKKFAITTPNCNWWVQILNRDFNLSSPPGALRYFPTFANIAPIFVQWQGDEFDHGNGAANKADPLTSTAAYLQRYADLYQRTLLGNGAEKYGLFANFLIIQRDMSPNVWLGGTVTTNITDYPTLPSGTVITVPSLKTWLKDPANVPQNGTAGLITDYSGYVV